MDQGIRPAHRPRRLARRGCYPDAADAAERTGLPVVITIMVTNKIVQTARQHNRTSEYVYPTARPANSQANRVKGPSTTTATDHGQKVIMHDDAYIAQSPHAHSKPGQNRPQTTVSRNPPCRRRPRTHALPHITAESSPATNTLAHSSTRMAADLGS